MNNSNILIDLFIIFMNFYKIASPRTIFKLIGPCEITLTVKNVAFEVSFAYCVFTAEAAQMIKASDDYHSNTRTNKNVKRVV